MCDCIFVDWCVWIDIGDVEVIVVDVFDVGFVVVEE